MACFIKKNNNKEHIEQKGLSDHLDRESGDESFRPVERKGHPLACHLPGSSCESKSPTAAVAHYPKLAAFQKDIYLVESTSLFKILIKQLKTRTINHS